MGNLLTSFFDYKVKKHALIFIVIFFFADKILYLHDVQYINSTDYLYYLHLYLNSLIVMGLGIVVNCKDKTDDERSILIRYSVLKGLFGSFAAVFGMIAPFSFLFKVESVSMLTILYCIQGLFAIYILLIYLGNKYNPSWLFKEETAPNNYTKRMIHTFYLFYAIAALLIVISFLFKH